MNDNVVIIKLVKQPNNIEGKSTHVYYMYIEVSSVLYKIKINHQYTPGRGRGATLIRNLY